MKLCWDNIENVRLTRNGNLRDVVKRRVLYLNVCEVCKEEFLGSEANSKFCGRNCYNRYIKMNKIVSKTQKDKWKDPNSVYNSKEYRKKLSKCNSGKNNPMYGKTHSEKTKEKMKKNHANFNGNNHPNWKGGYRSNGIPTYDTYAPQLEWCEEVRRNQKDPNILEVKCFKCNEWFVPKLYSVNNRLYHLKGKCEGEHRFYCSDNCKNSCSIFNKSPEQVMKENAFKAGRLSWLELTREVQPELRNMVLERDGNQCVKCGSKDNIQCHHIDPVANNPIESADVDNCITLCKNCHKKVHQKDGCKYNQLREC